MRYLKKYNESNEENNLDFIMAKIKENFSNEKVKELFTKERLEWSGVEFDLPPEEISDEERKSFNPKGESFYKQYGNGEAEDVILEQLISWFESKYSKLSDEAYKEVYDKLQEEYEFLNIA
jgi:hypothetical protein